MFACLALSISACWIPSLAPPKAPAPTALADNWFEAMFACLVISSVTYDWYGFKNWFMFGACIEPSTEPIPAAVVCAPTPVAPACWNPACSNPVGAATWNAGRPTGVDANLAAWS